MGMTFLIGGARAGKSTLAVSKAIASGKPCFFLATAEAGDDEMRRRIERHRAERPAEWTTIEEPRELAAALTKVPDDAALVLDCLTLWVTNLVLDDRDDDDIYKAAQECAAIASARAAPTFVVTNEVGLGVHPETELGRRFRDTLGRVNAIWAERSDETFFVVAGKTLPLC